MDTIHEIAKVIDIIKVVYKKVSQVHLHLKVQPVS